MKLQKQAPNNNPFSTESFQLTQEPPSEAIITLNLAKTENVEKFGGRIWTSERGDGSYAVLGKVSELSNIKYNDFQVKKEMLNGAQIEVRLSAEDRELLLSELENIQGRVADIHIAVTGSTTFGTLTLADGTEAPSAIFPGVLLGVRQGTATIQGDEFESQEAFDAFCANMASKTKSSANEYRAQMQLARATAPEAEKANVMG